MNAHEWVTVYGNPLPSGLVGLEVPVTAVATALPAGQKAGLEILMLKLLAAVLQSLDLLADASATSLHTRYPLLPKFYQAWFTESLRLLAAHPDWIKGDLDLPTLWGQWEQVKVGLQDHADYKTQLFLVTACLRALPDILTGRCKATEVLFPNSSMALVEGIYKGNAVADMFNTVLGDTVLAYCRQRLAQDPHVKVRILEIGAGTGGTTAGLIAKLQPLRQHIEEYCYTDVSKAFLHHADSHYAPVAPYLKTCLFDVSKPLAGQGILPDYYDLVIASNVLHATQSIRTAVRNAKAALRNRGCLLMNELSANALAAHLTFGLLEGWWLYQDGALRIPGCPGLSTQTWAELLEEEGFGNAYFPAQAVHHFGQQIIIAESDGVVRQLAATAPADQTVTPLPTAITPQPAAYSAPADQRQLRAQAVAYLKQLLAATLKIPAEAIDSAQAMEVYGLDSILVVQLANILHKQFTGITSTLFFEVQTLDALADHLLKTQAAAFIPLAERGQNPPAAPAPVSPMASSHYGLKKSPRLGQPTPPSHQPNSGHFPVAIIGLSGRYPQAADIHAFWDNLITGKNCISEIPAERWDWRVYFAEEKGKLGHHYSKWGGFLDDVDKFDPLFFQISPRDAERMDPQERLFLETVYASIEDAGYTPASLCPSRKIGVFVGVMNSLYTGQASHWSLANRVSYALNCQGPSLAVDTACSSSLTAIHLALESLYTSSSECAIAGGVNLILDPKHYGLLSEMTMISAGSQCRPFAADADGFVDGEGVGAVLLKPLAQAIADHDHIYGVIKASMVNAGGKTNGYTVPNPLAQARLISETLQKAGVSPDAVSYLEAHGTGTVLGDPIEVSALSQAFAASLGNHKNRQYCALGSVKSNIGHCESAAGIAGLTKVLLQMQHRQLAPSLHATVLNPHINFADTPFIVQQQPAAWHRSVRVSAGVSQELPRLAGLSSFGAGGANAHLLVEEYIEPVRQSRPDNPIALLVLSAKTPERLQAVARNLLVYVQRGQANLDLLDVAYTLQIGRVACSERLAFVAASLDELQGHLQYFLRNENPNQSLHLGQAKQDLETQRAVTEEIAATIEAWIATGQYQSLLAAWVQGVEIAWDKLYPNNCPHRVSLPTYPFARERYWLPTQNAQKTVNSPSLPRLTDLAYLPKWQAEAAVSPTQPAPARVLMVASRTALAFAQAIAAHHQHNHAGTEVVWVLLDRPDVVEDQGQAASVTYYDADNSESFRQCLQASPAFARVYFIVTGTDSGNTEAVGYELPLLRLLKYLKAHTDRQAYMDFFLLTQDCHRLADTLTRPEAAGLRGLAYALAQGDHRFLVRNLDVAHEDMVRSEQWPELIRQLCAEPAMVRGDTIKLQQGQRYRQTFAKLYWPSVAPTTALKQRGVYVLVGGSGTVGNIISRYLIDNYQAQVIWIGRTVETDPSLQQKLTRYTGSVVYFQADATCLSSLQQAVSRIKRQYPTINGAIFAGVVFSFDNSLAETTEADFLAIFQVKRQGSVNFYTAFQDEALDFMCYFSSGQAFAFSGAASLSAYASGITFADSYAQSLQHTAPFPVGTINWGFWQASLAAAGLGDNIGALQDDEGFACFERFVSALAEKRLNQALCIKASESVRALMMGKVLTEPLPALSAIPPVRPDKAALVALVSRCLADALKLSAADIDPDMAFSDYGMDSLVAVGFVKHIGICLNIELNPAIVFDYTSVNRLAGQLLEQTAIPAVLAQAVAMPPPKAGKQSAWPDKLRRLKRTKATSSPHPAKPEQQTEQIAIIGMAGQFPGAADVHGFWQNLITGKQGVGVLPEHYQVLGQPYPIGRTPENRGYQWGGVVADRDCFDPLFFNIAPREAEAMSPHQRLILQESWAALEDAGYNPKSLDGQAVSVYIGAEPNTYAQESFTGASDAIIASRLAYFLNLTGAAMVVNTGCSSSAVAIHLAAASLRSGEATMALAGGVFATLDQGMLMALADIDMLSPTGRCHTFDANADGTAFSEGVGVVVLKRLSDAIADGDPIYGVLVASGINQDGASNGMTAPNGLAQQALISNVYRRYRINPEQISYVEAHGTGTRLGDPVEANALVKAFGNLTSKSHYCAIGSTKAHIGHTSASAGVIGLIRILLSLRYRQILGLPHFRQLNPLIEFSGSAFYVNTETLVWHSPSGQPLMAALNSFGHSGTNAHLVVSEYIVGAAETTTTPAGVHLIVLSAKNADRLQAYAAKLLRFVQSSQQTINLSELAYTLQTGREAMPERLAFTVTSLSELAEKLEAFLNHQHEGLYCGQVPRHNGLLALLGTDAGLGNTLGNWFALGQYDKLLELWVQGVELDWTRLYSSDKPRRMSLPTYPFARERYWAGSASTPHACVAKASMSPPADEGLAYLLRWQAQPPGPYRYPVPSPQTVVLVYPPCAWGLEHSLSEAFKLHHPETLVVKIQLAEQSQQLSAHEWQCAVADGQSLAACLQGYSHIDSVYFLAIPDNQVLAADSVVQSQQYYEWSLLRLIQVLKAKIPSHAVIDCYLVTLDNYAIYGNAVQPQGAGVTGLAYALAQSDPRFAVRNLDVSRSDLADSRSRLALVNSIWQEAASDRGEVVKLSAGSRYKQRFYPWELPAATASAFKTGGVYLLLGGSGSVGRVITRHLLERYQAKVVWLGRTSVGDSALQQKLAQFSRWQGALSYSQADANDLASLQQAITGIKQQYPLINGAIFSGLVFHHERVLADTVDAEFGDMLAVKTVGSVNFYQALQGEALDFMCYFSSIQAFSFLSAKDSAAYAVGIVFADTFVQSLQATARFPVGSINWGYWADTTVGTDLANRLSKHFGLISDAEGCQFFEQFVHHLQQGVLSQALCLRAKASVRDLMASAREETMTLCKQEAPSLIQSLCQEGYAHYDPIFP